MNPLVSASNFNINVTNLTNSMIVTQNHNNNQKNPLEIPKKIKTASHKKSKSQGQKNNSTSIANIGSAIQRKNPIPVQNYKTSLEFYDAQLRKKK